MATEHIARLELYGYVDPMDDASGLADELDKAMLSGAIDAADVLVERIRQDVPEWVSKGWSDIGSRSITPLTDGARVNLSNTNEIAYYYWSGTKKHPIVARFASALRFLWPNAPASVPPNPRDGHHYFRRVMHPGTKKHPYLEEAGAGATPAMQGSFEDAVRKALEGT